MCPARSRFFHGAGDQIVRVGLHRGRLDSAFLAAPGRDGGIASLGDGIFLRLSPFGLWHLSLFYRAAQERGVNPEPFFQLDRVIDEKGRLAIMSLLAAAPQLSFTEMRDTLNMTDGNITAHLRTLQEAGYVSMTKEFQVGRPLTSFSLTKEGRKAFTGYIDLLEQIVQQSRSKGK